MRKALTAAVLVLLASCATGTGDTMDTTPPTGANPSSRFETAPPLPSQSGSPTNVPEAKLQAIKDDLAARGVVGEVSVVRAESVTWRDGSWGCPEPGKQYTQALVDGMRVIVRVGTREFDYRFGTAASPRLCLPRGER